MSVRKYNHVIQCVVLVVHVKARKQHSHDMLTYCSHHTAVLSLVMPLARPQTFDIHRKMSVMDFFCNGHFTNCIIIYVHIS